MLSGGTLFNAPSGTHMVPSSSDLISAVSHPLRRMILRFFVAEPHRCVSAVELAGALEEPVARVGYHLKTLGHGGVLRLNRGGGDAGEQLSPGWSLGVEPGWLGLMLEIWPEPHGGTAHEDVSEAAPRRPPRGRWWR